MSSVPQQTQSPSAAPRMVVCGDDALAQRLATELREVYRQRVALVVPPAEHGRAQPLSVRTRASTLLGRVTAAMGRAAGNGAGVDDTLDTGAGPLIEAAELTDEVLVAAGVEQAEALALVNDDDETNIRAALTARRLNPHLRLVIRLYNRKLGQHLAELLDQAAVFASPDIDATDATTTVLSDADTAAPALATTAIAATSKVVQVDGLLLRAAERTPEGGNQSPGLCTLALLSPADDEPGRRTRGSDPGPELLPDDEAVAAATGRSKVVLETVAYHGPEATPRRVRGAPLGQLFSRRLRWTFAGLVACAVALTAATWWTQNDGLLHATYVTLLDLFAMGEAAEDEPDSRQVIQLLSGFAGLLIVPVLLAAALEAFGTFRTASALRRPPRRLSGHVVLLGLGKIGTRVLASLHELGIPVVCVEEDPDARGVALARSLRVPVVLGDVTQEGVLESAKIHRARALLALTSVDSTNLEAALYARSVKSDVKVSLRLYDDEFATVVYRTLRAAHPHAQTLSRSCTHLAAPAFASAMMGRENLGSLPVERKVLLFAAVNVEGHPFLQGRTVAETFRPGHWRVIGLDAADPAERRPDLAAPQEDAEQRPPGLVWDLHPGYVLRAEDRVVVAATRRGLAELLGRSPSPTGGTTVL